MAETDSDDAPQPLPSWPGWPIATAICVRFYSRLPVPALPGEAAHALPDFRLVPRALPIAALVIALPGALLLLLAGLAGVSPTLAATLAVTALVLTTGALHEDGLADTADGLFGGQTPERRLEIMKDSRVGTFGALALGLSLLLRITALSAILQGAGAWAATAVILAAAPCSRIDGIHMLATIKPARPDGAGASVGVPSLQTALIGYALAFVIALLLVVFAGLPDFGLLTSWMLAWAVSVAIRRLCIRLIGGQTGDILGASQQLIEIAFYLGFAAALGWGGR